MVHILPTSELNRQMITITPKDLKPLEAKIDTTRLLDMAADRLPLEPPELVSFRQDSCT